MDMVGVTARYETPPRVWGETVDIHFFVPQDSAEMPLDHPLADLLENDGYTFVFYNYDE